MMKIHQIGPGSMPQSWVQKAIDKPAKTPSQLWGISKPHLYRADNMLTEYQIIKFIDFSEVWFLPESVARVAAIVGDHRCHTPRH
ncbi:hypothetical protein TNCV_3265051 [Trichonephila clavipes]|nr:hypothetical protein TNCV_3265051 [Trichonephila clavipes]